MDCGDTGDLLDLAPVSTQERAVFHPETLPLEAADAPVICVDATVRDGVGLYTTTAMARKNPEVAPAFPVLRSPVAEARVLPFFLGPCDDEFDARHARMQRQRAGMQGVPTTCIDDWDAPGFEERLMEDFLAALEGAREAASYCRHQLLCASRDGVSLRLENFPLGQVERRPPRPRKCPESDA